MDDEESFFSEKFFFPCFLKVTFVKLFGGERCVFKSGMRRQNEEFSFFSSSGFPLRMENGNVNQSSLFVGMFRDWIGKAIGKRWKFNGFIVFSFFLQESTMNI